MADRHHARPMDRNAVSFLEASPKHLRLRPQAEHLAVLKQPWQIVPPMAGLPPAEAAQPGMNPCRDGQRWREQGHNPTGLARRLQEHPATGRSHNQLATTSHYGTV